MPINHEQYFFASPYFSGFEHDSVRDQFFAHLEQTPQSIRSLLLDPIVAENVLVLSEDYQIDIELVPAVSRVIREISLGLLYVGDAPTILGERLGLDHNTAKNMADALLTHIFRPALQDINAVQIRNFAARIAQSIPSRDEIRRKVLGEPVQSPPPRKAQAQAPTENVNQNNLVDLRKT